MLRLLLVSILLFLNFNTVVLAQTSNLEKIRKAVKKETQILDSINERLENLQSAITVVKAEITNYKKREANLAGELEVILKQRKELDFELIQVDQRIQGIKDQLESRISSLYRYRNRADTSQFLYVARRPAFIRTAYYLKKVKNYDKQLITELKQSITQQEKKRLELTKLINNQDLIRELLVKQRKAVEVKLRKQASLSSELELEKKRLEPSLTALRSQALRLETVVLSYADQSVLRRSATASSSSTRGSSSLPKFNGIGLAKQKGRLILPIKRKLLRKFGKYKINGFKDMVKSKGVEFVAGSKEPVRAIAKGQVIFIGSLPGYGELVILDHGKRYYSLYGQVQSIIVNKGKLVSQGEQLALTIEKTPFYFELRNKAQAINPTLFYSGKI